MLYIAHRGNINGPDPEKENHPDYLISAINKGYHAELDVWIVDNKFLLGHDAPQYEIRKEFLYNDKFWCHAKDLKTISLLIENNLIHSFFHDQDACTLTSRNWIWTYPGQPILSDNAVAVMPEKILTSYHYDMAGAVCSDFVEKIQNGWMYE